MRMRNHLSPTKTVVLGVIAVVLFTVSGLTALADRVDDELYASPLVQHRHSSARQMQSKEMAAMRTDSSLLHTPEEKSGKSVGSQFANAMEEALAEVPETKPVDRMLVQNARLSMSVWQGELAGIVDKMLSLVKANDGYVESQSSSVVDSRFNLTATSLTLRIPASSFQETVDAIRAISPHLKVESYSLSTQDVTDSFVDATSRANTLDASHKALARLMEKATNVDEVMTVQRELNQMTQQFESLKARAISLQKQASLSTLHLNLREGLRHDIATWWSPLRPAKLAIGHLTECIGFVVGALLYVLVWAVVPLTMLAVYSKCSTSKHTISNV